MKQKEHPHVGDDTLPGVRRDWVEVADTIRQHNGAWVTVATGLDKVRAANIRRALGQPRPDIEVRTRTQEDGTVTAFARQVSA